MYKQITIAAVSATVLVASIAIGEQATSKGNSTAAGNASSAKNTNTNTTKLMTMLLQQRRKILVDLW